MAGGSKRAVAPVILQLLLVMLAASVPDLPQDMGMTCSVPTDSELLGLKEWDEGWQADHTGATWKLTSAQDVKGQYIVRFHEYRMQDDHRDTVSEALSELPPESFRWVPRRNRATKHPTDFGLLEIQPGSEAAVKGLLTSQPWVKAINPDRRLTRSLAWKRDKADVDPNWESDCDPEVDDACVVKPPGRMQTKPTIGLFGKGDEDPGAEDPWTSRNTSGRHLMNPFSSLRMSNSVTSRFQAEKLWEKGYHGQTVRMGVFDTGIRQDHPHVKNIKERSNWTHEPTLADGLGHGSFVAGVIASHDSQCPGFAPEVELHTFRVFTNDQVSYTSWFMDAFNYAIATDMDIVNLSIGGPDYLDEPFVDKVLEITSMGLIMVSAIGNDGPHYGTLNNPADMNDVIGVGGIDFGDKIASFSSRGMSTWELPGGYGRSKAEAHFYSALVSDYPDVVAYGKDVSGSKIQSGCRSLSGTSVASPVVAGAVCLLASVLPKEQRWRLLNPASMKQALVEGATRIDGPHMYEQGQGKINLVNSMGILKNYKPRASAVPGSIDLTNCPYMWPHCKQPLYASALPVMMNLTVLNGMAVTGRFSEEPKFIPSSGLGELIDIQFAHSDVLWPWSGYLALYITVKPSGADARGKANGKIEFTITSHSAFGEDRVQTSKVTVPFTASIIPTPPRSQRVLWDQFHSIRYPPGYLPRDNLDVRSDILDWHGDHPHTNYKDMYNYLIEAGYYVEVLGKPFTCFDALNYGSLVLADSEEEFYPEEIKKLQTDIEEHGLGLVVFAEWYNKEMLMKMRFFDDNTRSWWTPYTGGGNIPAVNDLLEPYGIAFGDAVLTGHVQSIKSASTRFSTGANIVRLPAGSYVHEADLSDRSPTSVNAGSGGIGRGGGTSKKFPVLGMTPHKKGRIAVFGDSNCLDSSHMGREEPQLFTAYAHRREPLGSPSERLPERRTDINFKDVSTVLNYPASCGADMDNAAYDLRAIFQKTTTETVALAARGIRDYGREEAKPKAEEPRVPEPQEPVPKEALKTAKAAEVGRQEVAVQEVNNLWDKVVHDIAKQAAEAQALHADELRNTGEHPPHPPQRSQDGSAEQLLPPADNGGSIKGGDHGDLQNLPHLGSLHFTHLLVAAGIIAVLLLWRVSRRGALKGTPRGPGTSRAFRSHFG